MLAIEGKNMFTYYSFRNVDTYISEYYFQNHYMLIGKYILDIFHSLFAIRNFRGSLHHLWKCWRGTWPEKVW